MTEAELKIQRTKAKATLELKQMHLRAGKATADEVAEAKRIFEALRDYQIPVTAPAEPAKPVASMPVGNVPAEAVVVPAMAVSEFTRLLEELTIQRAEAHKQMALRSNQLADYPDETNLKWLVDEIQEWKAQRNAIGEKIAYLKANGRLADPTPAPVVEDSPEAQQSAFLANLPLDRYELNKLLVNSLAPKLSRARKSLVGAKSDLKKAHYTKLVAKTQAEIDLVKSQMSALA